MLNASPSRQIAASKPQSRPEVKESVFTRVYVLYTIYTMPEIYKQQINVVYTAYSSADGM
jgi:hypothetical protein